MKVWHDNRLDREDDIPVEDLATRFLASEQAAWETPLDRALAVYLGAVERVSWEPDDPDLIELREVIGNARRMNPS